MRCNKHKYIVPLSGVHMKRLIWLVILVFIVCGINAQNHISNPSNPRSSTVIKTKLPNFKVEQCVIPDTNSNRTTDVSQYIFYSSSNFVVEWKLEIYDVSKEEGQPIYVFPENGSTYKATENGVQECSMPFVTWSPSKAGNFTVIVTGIDSEGNVNEQDIYLNVNPKPNLTLTVSDVISMNIAVSDIINKEDLSSKKSNVFSLSFKPLKLEDYKTNWKINLYDKNNNYVTTLAKGNNVDPDKNGLFSWYGENDSRQLSSGEKYIIKFFLENEIILTHEIRVGCIYEEKTKKIVLQKDIFFPGYETAFFDKKGFFASNYDAFDNIASVIKNNFDENMSVTIAGYANPTSYPNEKAMASENEYKLIPLSSDRALAVKNMLISMGVQENKMKTIGKGGLDLVARPNDNDENYQNRRIHFFIEYKESAN